jgi:dienelactone hydrolase
MRMGRSTGCVALAVVVAVLAMAGPRSAAADAKVPSAAPAPRYPLGIRVLDLEDPARSTPADPEGQTPVPGGPGRALATTVLYPADAGTRGSAPTPDAPARPGRFPLVLFSGGAPGLPADYLPLLTSWAAAGYVVAAPQYPVSSLSGPTDVAWSDQRDQVRDARFVLHRLLALDRAPARRGGLGGIVDRERIAAAGHSMGGLTTLALVSECCREPRIDASMVLAGVRDGEAGPPIRDVRGPVLFVHAVRDYAVLFTQSEAGYEAARPPKYLLEVLIPFGGALSHVLPFLPGWGFEVANRVAAVTDAFLDAYLGPERGAAARIRGAAAGSDLLVLRGRG